jgi:hypothetical protein
VQASPRTPAEFKRTAAHGATHGASPLSIGVIATSRESPIYKTISPVKPQRLPTYVAALHNQSLFLEKIGEKLLTPMPREGILHFANCKTSLASEDSELGVVSVMVLLSRDGSCNGLL